MSQFDPSKGPFDYGSQQTALDAEMMPVGPAPMSGMAVAGFVSSVTVCCPVLSPLLGMIFSLVGLVQTRGGLRRGRGLAIAGLIISLLVSLPLNCYVAFWGANFARDQVRISSAIKGVDAKNLETLAGPIYELGSPSFKSKITRASLTSWLQARFSSLGGLQSIAMNQQTPMVPDASGSARFTLEFVASCSAKAVPFRLKAAINLPTGRLEVEDVVLDDRSVVEEAEGPEAATPESKPSAPADVKPADGRRP